MPTGRGVRLLEHALKVQEILDSEDKAKRCDLALDLIDALLMAGGHRRVVEIEAPRALSLAEAIPDNARASRACLGVMKGLVAYGHPTMASPGRCNGPSGPTGMSCPIPLNGPGWTACWLTCRRRDIACRQKRLFLPAVLLIWPGAWETPTRIGIQPCAGSPSQEHQGMTRSGCAWRTNLPINPGRA
ncbi:MAG: hypothetical protein ACNA7X_06390 [Dehalococcoidia bacterium]